MDIEIRFIDRDGVLRCFMSAGFLSREAASRYAQSVMQTRLCRHYASAEICLSDSLSPIVVSKDGSLSPSAFLANRKAPHSRVRTA